MSLSRHVLHGIFAVFAALLVMPATAAAQQQAPAGTPEKANPSQLPAELADDETFSVTVRVVHAGQGDKALEGKPVILQAARPKGPFEPNDPKPDSEWTAVSDADGRATFDEVPASLASQGLRLHAVTTHGGVSFKSPSRVPAPDLSLSVPVYERGHDVSEVAIDDLQTLVHLWEGNLFIQQFYRLTVEGDQVLDTAMLSGDDFENGLPIELPVKAQSIDVQAPGETKVVNSLVFWKGTLKPGETVPVSVSFSMQVNSDAFTYDQRFDYPAKNASVVVPLESNHERVKLSYFEGLELAAPGFAADKVGVEQGALGSQNSGLFLAAKDRSLAAGESLQFELRGLPFGRPTGAWGALGLGIVGALIVFGFARREKEHVEESHASGEVLELLIDEREALLDDLALLEEDYREGAVSELEYERESLLLRERIALVMKKIGDLEEKAA